VSGEPRQPFLGRAYDCADPGDIADWKDFELIAFIVVREHERPFSIPTPGQRQAPFSENADL